MLSTNHHFLLFTAGPRDDTFYDHPFFKSNDGESYSMHKSTSYILGLIIFGALGVIFLALIFGCFITNCIFRRNNSELEKFVGILQAAGLDPYMDTEELQEVIVEIPRSESTSSTDTSAGDENPFSLKNLFYNFLFSPTKMRRGSGASLDPEDPEEYERPHASKRHKNKKEKKDKDQAKEKKHMKKKKMSDDDSHDDLPKKNKTHKKEGKKSDKKKPGKKVSSQAPRVPQKPQKHKEIIKSKLASKMKIVKPKFVSKAKALSKLKVLPKPKVPPRLKALRKPVRPVVRPKLPTFSKLKRPAKMKFPKVPKRSFFGKKKKGFW
uniref:Uncharacterized protein n=1 Tax=Pyxicephalus adspersus TaxID=30357 RepID=A0AAV3A7Q0_PYXAD|nr:TPA: hypothetical protein GDO54_018267 [Pyxicephalus adspersus]